MNISQLKLRSEEFDDDDDDNNSNNNNNNNGAATMSRNQAVDTDREVTANRPDIIIKNKQRKTGLLTDVAIPADRNV